MIVCYCNTIRTRSECVSVLACYASTPIVWYRREVPPLIVRVIVPLLPPLQLIFETAVDALIAVGCVMVADAIAVSFVIRGGEAP